MNKKLFVGNLSYETTEKELTDLFSQIGQVETVSIILDKITNRSKGFGFVEMATEEEAEKASKELDGKEFNGRNISVKEAKPLEERTPRRSFNRRPLRNRF